jgi:hypothetical protein
MAPRAEWSQRLLRKGVLVEETYNLFSSWDFSLAVEENLSRGLGGRQATQGWEDEVTATIKRRFRDFSKAGSLIVLAQRKLPLAEWRHALRLWVGAHEEPFHTFATGWLFEERERGRTGIRSNDLLSVVDQAAGGRGATAAPISDYSRIRAARDLVKTASDLGMVEGRGVVRTFANLGLSDDMLVYYAQLIAELEGEPSLAPGSRLWRLAYMSPGEVHLSLLHLHQFRRLDYQVAGSLVQLALPARSAVEYARQIQA